MNKGSKTLLTATVILLLASGPAMAGRGGSGGGFHSGGGGSYGGYHGSTSYGGGYRGSTANWSAAGHTPSFNYPSAASRPDFAYGSRSNFNAQAGWAERASNTNRPSFTPTPGHGAYPGPGPRPVPGPRPEPRPNPNWYHGNWHDNWNHPWYNYPAAWWTAGFVTGAALSNATPWSWGYWPYYNPYCAAPVVVGDTTIDYSQPIVLAAPPADGSGAQTLPQPEGRSPAADQAAQMLDAARAAFEQGDYAAALAQCDKAIAQQPDEVALHEFRGLTLFALHRYKEAAGTIYAVLSVGPGWDWTTLAGFYPDDETYTEQLRALEQYVNAHRNQPDVRFLLAYQYLICGHTDAAAAQLKTVTELNSKDQLSAQLLSALETTKSPEQPAPGAPLKPVEAAALAGQWTANRADGATVSLSLSGDGKYTWKFAQNGKLQEFSGDYAVADNLLILKKDQSPVMIGQVAMLAGDRFNFKLPGDNPSDHGLTFGK